MSFTSLIFFPFLLTYLGASIFLSQRAWLRLAASSSAIFYGYWDWRFLFLIFYVVLVSWYCGVRIWAGRSERERRLFVVISIVSCLTVLGIFKYFDFFVDSFIEMSAAFGLRLQTSFARIALPVGISFYTFHALSYTIDIYRRKLDKPSEILTVAVYLSFFPQLVAGPIVRAYRFIPQLDRGPIFNVRKIKLGLLIIAWGYFLKVAVADSIAVLVDPIFDQPTAHTSGDLLFAIFGYAFQIYGDFAGYSFIAIGLAKLQGFDFPANFLTPYFSTSFREFWQRWHTSLSSFLRDYLYIPLGGNRHGKPLQYRNLFVTMFLGGLWHGASYNFVIWGSLHGIYLALHRAASDLGRRLGFHDSVWLNNPGLGGLIWASKLVTVFAGVLFAWIFFRLQHLSDVATFVEGILAWQNPTVVTVKFQATKVLFLIAVTIAVDAVLIKRRLVARLRNQSFAVACVVAVLAVAIELLGSFGGGAFIYFRF